MILAAETLINVIIGTGGLVVVAIIGYLGQRVTRSQVRDLHDEVRTNHGLKAGQYLELTAASAAKAAVEAAVARSVAESLVGEFRKHAEQDRINFEEIRELIAGDTSTTK